MAPLIPPAPPGLPPMPAGMPPMPAPPAAAPGAPGAPLPNGPGGLPAMPSTDPNMVAQVLQAMQASDHAVLQQAQDQASQQGVAEMMMQMPNQAGMDATTLPGSPVPPPLPQGPGMAPAGPGY